MGRYCFLLLFSLFLSISCSDDDNDAIAEIAACGVENVAEELVWLRTEIERLESMPSEDLRYNYISKAENQDQTVFVFVNCNPSANTFIPVYDCNGQLLNEDPENQIPLNELENQVLIWRPSESSCQFDF